MYTKEKATQDVQKYREEKIKRFSQKQITRLKRFQKLTQQHAPKILYPLPHI